MRDDMKKFNSHISTLLGLAVIASLLVGCSPGAKLPCPETGEEIPSPAPREEYVSVTLQNNTCMSVCQLLVSPNHCEYMGGVDWVKDHPLRIRESVTLEVPPGKYAVWFELCNEEFKADEDINVRSDYTHAILDDPGRGGKPPCGSSLKIINNSAVPICKLWISNSESTYDSWNWVGAEHIQPGESLTLALRADDTYIIRAEDCDGNRLRFEGDFEISGHQGWTVP
jgi:hypothetical protein